MWAVRLGRSFHVAPAPLRRWPRWILAIRLQHVKGDQDATNKGGDIVNEALEEAAVKAVTADGFETLPHYCQRWTRQVVETVYGKRFEDVIHKANAISAGLALRSAGYSIPLQNGSVPGDLLFKLHGSGGDGHVGIRVLGNKVAENSSVHWDGHDARGFRSLKEFGHFDLIIRLPLE